MAEIYVEVEISVDASELRFEEVAQLRELQARHMDGAHLGKRDGTGAVNDEGASLIYLSPDLKAEFIARSDHVIGRDWDVIYGRKGRWSGIEEVGTEDGQHPAGAARR